jgi:hypothetical protein
MCQKNEIERVDFDFIQRTKCVGYKTSILLLTHIYIYIYIYIYSSIMFYLKQLWVAQNIEWNERTSNKQ